MVAEGTGKRIGRISAVLFLSLRCTGDSDTIFHQCMSFSDLPDDELALQAAAHPDAFAVLYDRYVRQIYAFAASRLRCRCEAEDATSDTWMKALKAIAHFKPTRKESVPAWLFAIARNVITDMHRTRRPGEQIELDDVVDLLPNDDAPPEARLEQRRQFVALQESLDELPEKQAHCVRLRYYGGLRNVDIAELEGISEKTVASNISRALETLRTLRPELSSLLPS